MNTEEALKIIKETVQKNPSRNMEILGSILENIIELEFRISQLERKFES